MCESVQRCVLCSPTSRSRNPKSRSPEPTSRAREYDSRPHESTRGSTGVQRQVLNSRNHTQLCPSPHSGCPIAHGSDRKNTFSVSNVELRESNITLSGVQRRVPESP